MEESDASSGSTHSLEALQNLNSRLSAYAVLYESSGLDLKRRAISSALVAVSDFLESHAFPPNTLLAIMHPALALAEREDSILDPVFCERSSGGRPKASASDDERKGILAAFANAWLEHHKSENLPQRLKLAAAAQKMRGGWFGDVTRANLTTARDMINQEAKDHPAVVMAKAFGELFDDAKATFGAANAFQAMLDYMNSTQAGGPMGISKTPHFSSSDDD